MRISWSFDPEWEIHSAQLPVGRPGQLNINLALYPKAWENFNSNAPALERALSTRQVLQTEYGLSADEAAAISAQFMNLGRGSHMATDKYSNQSLVDEIRALAPQMAQAAQAVYDEWEQDEDGLDFELGAGGICDRVANAMGGVIAETIPDIDVMDGGQPGDEHAFPVVARNSTQEAVIVDIPYTVYERGGGYSWEKIPNVVFDPSFVEVSPVDWEWVADVEGWQDYDSSVDDPQLGPDEEDHYSKVATDDPDPNYSFMYYKSALEVVPWHHNVRYRDIADRLLRKFNTRLEDGGFKDDEGDWAGGDIFVKPNGLQVEFKQLADPEIQTNALVAIRHWYDDEHRKDEKIKWEMEGEETRHDSRVKKSNEFEWFQAAENGFNMELSMTGNYEQAVQVATQEAVTAGASPEQAQQTAQQIGEHYKQTMSPGSELFDRKQFVQGIGQAAQQVFHEFKTNEPDWLPLETFFGNLGHPERVNDFMFMGYDHPEHGAGNMLEGLRMYKNRETRKYLFLDSTGTKPYLYNNGSYDEPRGDSWGSGPMEVLLYRVYGSMLDSIYQEVFQHTGKRPNAEEILQFLQKRDKEIAQWFEDNPQ